MTGAGWDSATGRLGPGAAWYAEQLRWKVFPVYGIINGKCGCGQSHASPKDHGKHPHGDLVSDGFKSATDDSSRVRDWWAQDPEANVGVWCEGSGFLVLDIDPRHGGLESWGRLDELTEGALGKTVEAQTGEYSGRTGRSDRGRHLFYRVKPGERLRGGVEGLKGIDVKHRGYVLINPSRHASGVCYEWVPGRSPWDCEMAEAPEELMELIRKAAPRGSGGTEYGVVEWGGDKLDVDALVQEGISEGERAVKMYRIACGLSNRFKVWQDELGKVAVKNFMAGINEKACHPPMEWGSGGNDDALVHTENAINFVVDNPPDRGLYTPETKEYLKQAREWLDQTVNVTTHNMLDGPPALPGSKAGVEDDGVDLGLPPDVDDPLREPVAGEESGILKRTLSDLGNGRRFADYFARTTKYTVGLGWHCWDGSYWAPDLGSQETSERAKRLPAIITREAATYTDDDKIDTLQKFSMRVRSNAALNATVSQAQSDPRISVGVETWDSDDYLLGVQNGVVDLRTGELMSGDPRHYITKRCRVGYTPGMRNVRFESFLDFACGGDPEFKEWLQKAAGLTISGRREQDLLFLVYGKPGTGKNTLVEALYLLMDAYSVSIEPDLLLSRRQASQQDMYMYAEMLGKRMMWVDELPEAERMKDDKVKKLTGSETIDGRSPGERPISFRSKGKLWISTNHRPPIREDAMWRRLRPIPFERVPERPDPTLKPYIFDPDGGLPAVLSWAVDGAVKYFGSPERDALGWCTAVWDAAEVYRQEEDTIRIFLDEETRRSADSEMQLGPLYQVYRMWSEDRGEHPQSIRSFQRKIMDQGLRVDGMGKKALVRGVALIPRVVDSGASWDTLIGRARG